MTSTLRQIAPELPGETTSKPPKQGEALACLDLDVFVPFFLVNVSNSWLRQSSAEYRKQFGVGVVEWRVLATLAIMPDTPAARICSIANLDKAAVSRALKSLLRLNHITFVGSGADVRKGRWRLTLSGLALHGRILEVALAREKRLLNGVSSEELDIWWRVMRRMLANLAAA